MKDCTSIRVQKRMKDLKVMGESEGKCHVYSTKKQDNVD